MNQSKIFFVLIIAIGIFSCNLEKTYEENELITSQKDQEKFLIGKWEIIGNMESNEGIYMNVDGEIEFQKPRQFDLIIGMNLKNSYSKKTMLTIACKADGTWKWYENEKGDVDRESPNSCDCSFTPQNNQISKRKLNELMESLALCKDGKIFLGGENNDTKSSFHTGNIEFRKNKIDIKIKNYEKGRSTKMSLIRKDELK